MSKLIKAVQEWNDSGLSDFDEREKIRDIAEEGDFTEEEAAEALELLGENGDTEVAHVLADKILLALVDEDVKKAYNSWGKWYA